MTEDEYLDSLKKNGWSVYYCTECKRRLVGGPASYHEFVLRHKLIKEINEVTSTNSTTKHG